jgi:hypothetical protein
MIIIYVMNNRKNTYVCVSDNTNGVYIYMCVYTYMYIYIYIYVHM